MRRAESRTLRSSRDRFWIVLFLLFPILVLPNLGNAYLWQDEGETAVLARSVLLHGYPLATHGSQVVSDQPDQRDLKHGVWIWTPWLPMYVAALSFAVFGATTWAARLPFALTAWSALLLSYPVFLELTASRRLSRFASTLLATSVPFLLHARQCRYYALLALFVLAHTWGYVRILRGSRWGRTLVVASGVCLAQTFLPQLAVSTAVFGGHAHWVVRDRAASRRFLAASTVVAAVSLPFFVYTASWARDYGDYGHGFDSLGRLIASLRSYVLMLHAYMWPFFLAVPLAWRRLGALETWHARAARAGLMVLASALLFGLAGPPGARTFGATLVAACILAILAVVGLARARADSSPATGWPLLAGLLVAGTVLSMAALSTFPYFRYLVGVIPFAALLTAHFAGELVRWNRAGLAIAGALLVGTNLVSQGPFVVVAHQLAPTLGNAHDVYDHAMNYGHRQSNIPAVNVSRLGALSQPWSISPLFDYLGEITHDHDGPVEGVVRYVRANGRPGQVLMATYENFPLMFYTDLTVVNIAQARTLPKPPDWIFVHKTSVAQLPPPVVSALESIYEPVKIGIKEVNWENIPEPYWHYYRTRLDGDDVSLFRRKPPVP